MSLVMLAISTCLAKALTDKTLAGSRILESDPTALRTNPDGTVATEAGGPFISLFVHAGKGQSRAGFYANGKVDIIIESGVTLAMWHTDKETGARTCEGVGFLPTSASMERMLDLMHRQIVDAMSSQSVWAVLLRAFFTSAPDFERAGIASAENGQRLAARQVKFSLDVVDDPELQDLDEFYEARDSEEESVPEPVAPFSRFLLLLHSSEDGQDQALVTEILEVLEGGTLDWATMAEQMGFSYTDMAALGAGPLDWSNSDQLAEQGLLNGTSVTQEE
ncbi:hypothetical protein [Cohaesibacter marisflavi]|uniref:hypothetical protein n=1 Tax=Cohaesibacter marisflavi TaxID=655353 RepID=UPI0029C6E031|nr:hypothetical protein [Cohaesibacter marisflavi]